jgi:2-iminobutanoate/2-iminopropanoate deaminase
MADRTPIDAEGAPEALGPYSHAVRSGGLVFLSGQTPVDPGTGKLIEGGAGAQAARCLENLSIVAEAAGCRLADAVRCGIYVVDMGEFAAVNEAYGAFFGEGPPARSTIGVASLPLGARVEIDAIVAARP